MRKFPIQSPSCIESEPRVAFAWWVLRPEVAPARLLCVDRFHIRWKKASLKSTRLRGVKAFWHQKRMEALTVWITMSWRSAALVSHLSNVFFRLSQNVNINPERKQSSKQWYIFSIYLIYSSQSENVHPSLYHQCQTVWLLQIHLVCNQAQTPMLQMLRLCESSNIRITSSTGNLALPGWDGKKF